MGCGLGCMPAVSMGRVREQFLNGTSAQCRLYSAILKDLWSLIIYNVFRQQQIYRYDKKYLNKKLMSMGTFTLVTPLVHQ